MAHDYQSYTSRPALTKAILLPVKNNKNDIPDPSANIGRARRSDLDVANLAQFFLNPASWSETKSTKWIKHTIPGLSDPHQQWISGGPRTITFEALVTKDIGESTTKNIKKKNLACNVSGTVNEVDRIAGISTLVQGLTSEESRSADNQGTLADTQKLDLDITDKLNFYRSLTYPNVAANSNRVSRPPNLVRLLVGSTFGRRTQNAFFVVDKVDFRITKQYADLTPIEAVVTFTLTEFVSQVLSSDADILTDTK